MIPQEDAATYPVEQINISTPIEIKEKLDKGELVFIAGDRVSESGSTIFETKFLGKTVEFPLGTFKFAKLMDCPTFFIVLVKNKAGEKNKIFTSLREGYTFNKFSENNNVHTYKLAKIASDYSNENYNDQSIDDFIF